MTILNTCLAQRISSTREYSEFMLRGITPHVVGSHVLIVQWDGFILRPDLWNPCFLDYDYIGAVWPQFSHLKSAMEDFHYDRSSCLKRCKTHRFLSIIRKTFVSAKRIVSYWKITSTLSLRQKKSLILSLLSEENGMNVLGFMVFLTSRTRFPLKNYLSLFGMYQPIAAVELIATTLLTTSENLKIVKLLWPFSKNAAGTEKPRSVFCRRGYALKQQVFSTKTGVPLRPLALLFSQDSTLARGTFPAWLKTL